MATPRRSRARALACALRRRRRSRCRLPEGLVARTNGTPGHTLLSWPPLDGAKSYVVQISPDPITANSWAFASSCTTASADVGGAEPGKKSWFRVSGVNGKGQGPWSEPTSRPVM